MCYCCDNCHEPYDEGIYVYECGCIAYCPLCRPAEFKTQTKKHDRFVRDGCWGGGWNPENKPIPAIFSVKKCFTSLDAQTDKIYKLKSSGRKFRVTDGDDKTVVIEFLDDKMKIDLAKKDFDDECEIIEE